MAFNWTGAAAGAGAGMAFGGPLGAGVGAGVGGFGGGGLGLPDPLGGLFKGPPQVGKPNRADFTYGGMAEGGFQGLGNQWANQQAPQADLAQYQQSRGYGMQDRNALGQQIQQMQTLAHSDKDSAAYQQMMAGRDASMQQSLALARSQNGAAGQAAAMRQAVGQNAATMQQTNQSAGIMRAQEVQQANAQVGQLMTAQRAADLQSQGLDAQTAFQQAGLEMQQRQLGLQGQLGFYGLGQNASQLQMQGSEDYWKTLLGAQAANAQAQAQYQGGMMGMIGAGVGGLAAGGVFSDVRAKTDIAPIGYGFQNPGQPTVTTGGAMTMPQMVAPPMDPRAQQRNQAMGQMITDFTRPRQSSVVFQPVDQYLPTLSDERSKEQIQALAAENHALKRGMDFVASFAAPTHAGAVGAVRLAEHAQAAMPPPPPMQHLSMPAVPAVQAPPDWQRQALARQQVQSMMQPAPANPYLASPAVVSDKRAKTEAFQAGVAAGRTIDLDAPEFAKYFQGTPGEAQPSEGPLPGPLGGPTYDTMVEVSGARYKRPARATTIEERPAYPELYGVAPGARGRLPDLPPASQSPLVHAAAQIQPYSFRYKGPYAQQYGGEQRVGIIAQQAEQNPVTAPTVETGPDGMKRIDAGQLTTANTAMLSEQARYLQDLDERQRRLEETMRKGGFGSLKGYR